MGNEKVKWQRRIFSKPPAAKRTNFNHYYIQFFASTAASPTNRANELDFFISQAAATYLKHVLRRRFKKC